MHIHILGICGTFMAGVAVLAKQQGHRVTGSDANIYPPMSTQLQSQGIEIYEGYDPKYLTPTPDCIIIGNAMKRGNPTIEYILNENLPFISGPQWLAENILQNRWVIAVAGTHGKTTTSSMIAWILQKSGFDPGYLIGGIPKNFTTSASLGKSDFFVIEADEYDTAFFDKRSKFVLYRPRTVVLNNLEFDHADIFPDLAAIQTQFHHLVRTIPNNGLIICPKADENVAHVLKQGSWTPVQYFGDANSDWQAKLLKNDGSEFEVYFKQALQGKISWNTVGLHNVNNALAAIAACHHAGITIPAAIDALNEFSGVKRRLEVIGNINGVTIYDDFAHHPTAITTTLAGLRHKINGARLIAVLELGSFTMRTGVHKNTLVNALKEADMAFFALPKGEDWGVAELATKLSSPAAVFPTVEELIESLAIQLKSDDHVVIMSNTGFDGLHQKLLSYLNSR